MQRDDKTSHHGLQACLLLTTLGGGLCAYLLARAFALLTPPWPALADLCSSWLASDCAAALTDTHYWILGVPLGGWGLVYFTLLAGLLGLARFIEAEFATDALLAATSVALAGIVVSVALTLTVLLGTMPFCPLCLLVHVVNALLLLSLHHASGRSLQQQAQQLRAFARWLFRRRAETPARERWKLVAFGSVALLATLAHQWVYVESAQRMSRSRAAPDPDEILAAYQASPRIDLPIGAEDPRLGPRDAPVQLVVFASFMCPSCRRFAETLAQMHRRLHDQLFIVFKHYPLSTQCNARLTVDKQRGACELAWAAEAAHRQGRFWQFHDALFAVGAGPPETVIDQAALRANLDRARFDADRRAATVQDRVAADVEMGTRLMIPGTPAVFLNGRLVSSTSGEALAILIRHELEGRVAESRATSPWYPSVKVGLRKMVVRDGHHAPCPTGRGW